VKAISEALVIFSLRLIEPDYRRIAATPQRLPGTPLA
jgi:hypothetical protein